MESFFNVQLRPNFMGLTIEPFDWLRVRWPFQRHLMRARKCQNLLQSESRLWGYLGQLHWSADCQSDPPKITIFKLNTLPIFKNFWIIFGSFPAWIFFLHKPVYNTRKYKWQVIFYYKVIPFKEQCAWILILLKLFFINLI